MTERELLERAYKLLEDISHPFRNVERYDVEKWLEDATLVLGTEEQSQIAEAFRVTPEMLGELKDTNLYGTESQEEAYRKRFGL